MVDFVNGNEVTMEQLDEDQRAMAEAEMTEGDYSHKVSMEEIEELNARGTSGEWVNEILDVTYLGGKSKELSRSTLSLAWKTYITNVSGRKAPRVNGEVKIHLNLGNAIPLGVLKRALEESEAGHRMMEMSRELDGRRNVKKRIKVSENPLQHRLELGLYYQRNIRQGDKIHETWNVSSSILLSKDKQFQRLNCKLMDLACLLESDKVAPYEGKIQVLEGSAINGDASDWKEEDEKYKDLKL